MAKLITILAASVGGGLLLGAGIRLGEAIVGTDLPPRREAELAGKLTVRLGALEERLQNLEEGNPGAPVEDHAAEMAAIRSELNAGDREREALNKISLQLRGELRGWIEENVGARLGDVEAKLRAESERSQRQMLDAFVDGVQTRVMQRISRLEEEVAGQSAAMTELRECSLRTEQSMQKLLGGLDRLIIAQPPSLTGRPSCEEPAAQNAHPEPAKGEAGHETPKPAEAGQPPAEPEPQVEPRQKSRPWSIFR